MKFNKKAELDDVILSIGVLIGIIIIVSWFIFFLSKQSIQSQNVAFDGLNKFSTYYELITSVDEAEISGIQINAIENSVLTVDGTQVCISAENMISTCNNIISNSTNNYQNTYQLNEINYFKFIKETSGAIQIEKQY